MESGSEHHKSASEEGSDDRISPSKFMRELRPEYYSDTKQRNAYVLSAAELEYRLETITSRNQTQDFEIFCRKLCERAICPNLRPQTGPDGGGDSKADTETYPVSDEIAGLTYIGEANSGRERWAFAFSAKKTWAAKVRSDVKGLIDTGRAYDRIICITSQFAKAKTRAKLEDELFKKYSVRITIHDRSWITNEIIAHDRMDLALNYLGVGTAVADPLRLGPQDYSRTQQLADIDRTIAEPESFRGMERQLVTEALVAAKLSRALGRPRIETDGRFAMAIRLAEQHGTHRQKLETAYERIWTGFWWFDDFDLLNSSYDGFESRALRSKHAKDLEFLGNLNQLLVNSVVHGHMCREECKYDERTGNLTRALQAIAGDAERPNNRLEAEVDLLRIELNGIKLDDGEGDLSAVWYKFSVILDKAAGLGEFDADKVAKLIEIVGPLAGSDPAYNDLIEKLAEFVGSRKSDGEGALLLLRRAQKLEFKDRFDMIRLLGKAATRLAKREYNRHLIEATQLLSIAYRSARLPWASRASCVFAAASIVIEGEEDSDLPISFVPTMKVWAWAALELCHIPDFLFAIQMMNGFVSGLPLSDESKAKVAHDIRELDMALGCLFLNQDETELLRVRSVPDILEALGLFTARTALLYALGQTEVLRGDGSLPKEDSDEEVRSFLSILKSQPVADSLLGPMVLNGDGPQTLATVILGMRVELDISDAESVPIAEAVLGCLEAFFATATDKRVAPHTESFRIHLQRSSRVNDPTIETNELDMASVITWPTSLSVTNYERQRVIRDILLETAAHVMGATCIIQDSKVLIRELCTSEAVQQRIMLILAAASSYSRVISSNFSRLSDWDDVIRQSYPLREDRIQLLRTQIPRPASDEDEDDDEPVDPFGISHHRQIRISSVINVHAWNEARWRGCGYFLIAPDKPPCMAFLFENEVAARKIFERLRERFGPVDEDDIIGISIIRDLPEASAHHYCLQVSSRESRAEDRLPSSSTIVATRSLMMQPSTGENLNGFLDRYRRFGAYYFLAAIGTHDPEYLFDLAIIKRRLAVKSAANLTEHDVESLVLREPG